VSKGVVISMSIGGTREGRSIGALTSNLYEKIFLG